MEYDNNHFIIASRAYSLHGCMSIFAFLLAVAGGGLVALSSSGDSLLGSEDLPR
jgi:hypothetical protein